MQTRDHNFFIIINTYYLYAIRDHNINERDYNEPNTNIGQEHG